MASVTRTATVTADAWFALADGQYGNGHGSRMGVGYSGGGWGPNWQNRFAIKVPRSTLFDGVPNADAITAFDIKLRAWDACFGLGGTVRFFLERATTAMSENSHAGDCTVNVGGSVGVARWPGPDRDATNRGSYSGSPTNGQWITATALALGKWWFAHPEVTELVLVAVAANAGLTDVEEETSARRAMFYTAQTSSAPYASLTYNDNLAPYAPTDLSPADGSKYATDAGTSAAVSSRHTDTEGNAATKYQAQWFPAGTTDAQADAGTVAPTKDNTVTSTTAHNAVRTHTFTGLATRTAGEWRMRFYDGQWGPWSLLQTLSTAFKPSAVNLTVEPGTTDPLLYASISSADPGDFITAIEEYVYQDPAGGTTITKWAPGKQAIGGAPTRSEVEYGGSPLAFGTQYRRRVIVYNRDDIPSDLTANTYFTPLEAVGPDVKIGGVVVDLQLKLNTVQPNVRLTDPGAANIDQARVEWLNEAGTVVLSDSGVVAFASAAFRDVQAPAGIYQPGQRPRGRAYIRITGNANMGPAREFQMHLNSTPGSPYPITVAGGGGTQTVIRDDGVWVTTDDTPDATLPFRDVDKDLGYVEAMNRQEVEVRDLADAHVGASPYIDAALPISEVFTLPAIPAETTRKFRARVDDNGALRSAFSEYVFVKYSAAPTLDNVVPAAAATVTDPTPTFTWDYASAGGKDQAGYQLIARIGDTIVFDTGYVEGVGNAVDVDPYLLPDGVDVDWTLVVYDTDGLSVTVSRTFTTDFTVPPELTGLTIEVDDAEKALLIVWNESGVADAEFYAYHVEARTEGGQWRRITTITDKDIHAFLFKGAAHNRETIIRVIQDNGFAESVPVEESAVVSAEGYWVRTASRIDELDAVTGHGPGDTETKHEVHEPLGREEKVILDWGTTGYEGRFQITTNDREQVDRLRAYKRDGEIVMFKFPYGAVRYARIMATPDTDGVADWVNASVDYIEVSPTSATF